MRPISHVEGVFNAVIDAIGDSSVSRFMRDGEQASVIPPRVGFDLMDIALDYAACT